MASPVGFGRSFPLMAPADLPAAGTPTGAGTPIKSASGGASAAGGKKDAGKAPDPKADDKKSADKSKKAPARKKAKPKAAPVDVNALKKDVDDLKARTLKANLEGRSTFGGNQQLHFLKAEAEVEDVKLYGSDTTYLGLDGKLDANSGYEDAKGLGFPSGKAPYGSLLQATDDSKWFASATFRLVHKSDVADGYKVSTGVGFTDNRWSLDVKAETSSLVDPKNSLKLYLSAALTTPTLSDPKWSKGGKVGLKYKSDQGKNPDPIMLDKADVSFELLDKVGTTVSRLVVLSGVRFANNQTLEAKYTRLMLGETKSSTLLTYKLPLDSVVTANLEGLYDSTEKLVQYGVPNAGVSLDGSELPSQVTGLESGDYLSVTLKFQFNLGPVSPYLGFGLSKATSGVENLTTDASRFFALAGLDFNKAK